MDLIVNVRKQKCQNHEKQRHYHVLQSFKSYVGKLHRSHHSLPEIEDEHECQSEKHAHLHIEIQYDGPSYEYDDRQEEIHHFGILIDDVVLACTDIDLL